MAGTGARPESLEESKRAGMGLSAVVRAHNLLDGLAGLVGVVEGDSAHVVVKDVSLDDTVEDVAADESELAVNGGSSTASKSP